MNTQNRINPFDVERALVENRELVAFRETCNAQRIATYESRIAVTPWRTWEIVSAYAPNTTEHRISDGHSVVVSNTPDLGDALNEQLARGYLRA